MLQQKGSTALIFAARRGDPSVVTLLLDAKANVNAVGNVSQKFYC
jgi:ankyrin repeat protein